MNTINLYEYALAKARASVVKRELAQVAEASGLDYSWLGKFARGVIPGASYKKVDQLATYYMRVEELERAALLVASTGPVAPPSPSAAGAAT